MQKAIKKFYDSLNKKANAAIVNEALHDNWIIHPALPGNGLDKEKYKAAVQPIFTGLPDFNITIDDVVENGDIVAVRGHVTATHKDNLFGVPATGTPITYLICDFHRLKDGKIAESWHVEDWLSVMFQIGLIKL